MRVGAITDMSLVDGPGPRLMIFFTGCSHNCEGCHNVEFQNSNYGEELTIEYLIAYIKDRKIWNTGIGLSGGEPCEQPQLIEFLKAIREDEELKDINIWMWTGYTIDNVNEDIKNKIDFIVDGKFEKDKLPAKWRGSSNQKIWKKGNVKFEEVLEE